MCLPTKDIYLLVRVHFQKKSEKDLFDDIYAFFFLIFLIKAYVCGYSFEWSNFCVLICLLSNEYLQHMPL